MFQVYPEQLIDHLNKKFHSVYLLHGNDDFLIQEGLDAVIHSAMMHGFKEHHIFRMENNTVDWQEIFYLCQARSIFSENKILHIVLSDSNSSIIDEKMLTLVGLLHSDLLLIIQINKLSKEKKEAMWFKKLVRHLVLVTCQTPQQEGLFRWVSARAKKNRLKLETTACQFLCYCYEGNLLAIAQELDQLKLLWPDEEITLSHIEQTVENNSAYFTPFHWIDALLETKSKRALRILQQLRLEGNEPAILLRILQRELLLLLNLKRQSEHQSLHSLFDKFHVWRNRRTITEGAISRLSQDQLRQAIYLLTRIELLLKQDQDSSVWSELTNLSLFLCYNKSLSHISMYS